MNAVSLFAGVGGFDLALERNGIEVVAAVEIDAKARGILEKRFPNSKLFADVCEVKGKDLLDAGFEPAGGIITGGFPCQDLSLQENEQDWLVADQDYFGKSSDFLLKPKRKTSFLKMSLVYYPQMTAEILELSSQRWMTSGLMSRGECLMLNTLESPNAAVECSLSDVLEVQGGAHLPKYSLSPKAAAGILRRATKRGKVLPQPLQTALEQVAMQ